MYAIDFHTHVFPDHLASKAVEHLAGAADVEAKGKGTLDDLREKMDEANVKTSILAAIATRIDQVASINRWLWSNRSERFEPFAAIHPEDPDRRERIHEAAGTGFKGIKLHPNYQSFYPDEERILELCRAIADEGMILLLHSGVDWAFEENMAAPQRLVKLMEEVPDLKLVAAHCGGFENWEDVEKYLAGADVWFDISFTLPFIEKDQFMRIARKHGTDRLLFGTDYPWATPGDNLKILNTFDFTEEEKEQILHKNAEELLSSK